MVVRTLIAIALIGLSGAYARSLAHRGAEPQGQPSLERLPRDLAGWSSTDRVVDEETARVLGADRTLHRRYRNRRGEEVGVFLAYFARQQVNAQVHSPRHCLPGGGWRTVELAADTLHLGVQPQPIMRMLVQRQEYRHEILYWFQTRTGSLTSEYALKLNLMMNALRQRPTDVVFVRYDAAHGSAAALRALAAEIDPPLRNALREAGLH
jgi:EpsI family protein